MPAHKGPGGNHHERFFEKPGPEDQRQSCRIGEAATPDLVIPVVSQLLSKNKTLAARAVRERAAMSRKCNPSRSSSHRTVSLAPK